ncbi:DUF1232 domain-containing protein [Bermanella marisrubri]|uniref:DUF1232 domain-containing protein n=1 Tax=Bermanella marisrubri TaxID=207949 RepID=Q1N5R9_9GAMM|nr:DUF1232 domain-containing protein [Bermanella marisrubri]EAT13873.1 hypothetical protein RED65_10784 [Oceanobacter sp. RED65] [Bermanella marisrubri]QIZ84633.1 DUF1232 domain-containing protein [Bermanella marisrubri]
MSEHSKNKAEEELKRQSAGVSKKDLEKVIHEQDAIEDKFKTSGPLGRYIEDAKLLFSLIKDYANGSYRAIPWYSIAAIVAALLYVLNPFDILPDLLPLLGLMDDAFVIAKCLSMVESDLHAYKAWKLQNQSEM